MQMESLLRNRGPLRKARNNHMSIVYYDNTVTPHHRSSETIFPYSFLTGDVNASICAVTGRSKIKMYYLDHKYNSFGISTHQKTSLHKKIGCIALLLPSLSGPFEYD